MVDLGLARSPQILLVLVVPVVVGPAEAVEHSSVAAAALSAIAAVRWHCARCGAALRSLAPVSVQEVRQSGGPGAQAAPVSHHVPIMPVHCVAGRMMRVSFPLVRVIAGDEAKPP